MLSVPYLTSGLPGLLWALEMLGPVLSLTVILFMPMRNPALDAEGISKPFAPPTSGLRSPEDNFSLWQWMTISWMWPLISVGYKRQIHDEDVWQLPYQFHHGRLHLLFRDIKGSVIARLLKANAPDLLITSFLGILESASELVPIVFLQQLLAAIQVNPPQPRVAAIYAILTLVARLVNAQSCVFSLWFTRRCYERSRGEMITMIYEKTLRRKAFTIPSAHGAKDEVQIDDIPDDPLESVEASPLAINGDAFPEEDEPKQSLFRRIMSCFRRRRKGGKVYSAVATSSTSNSPSSTGKILNLCRNDVYEVAQRFWEFPSLLTKPLNFALSLALIWHILGPASLLGILVVVLAQVANAGIIRILLRWERARRAVTDGKLQLTTQFVESLRHLRWYAWADAWLVQILDARRTELRYRIVTNLLGRAVAAINLTATYLFPAAAFFAYTVVEGRPLTVDVAFPALTLFNILDNSLRGLPDLITVLLNAAVAMGRIEGFMAEPDKEADTDGRDIFGPAAPLGPLELDVSDASFSWPGSRKVVLNNVSFSCMAGLTLVCGRVGIGKTALLQAVLGELDQRAGTRAVPEEMAGYCAQTPWLQSMSIRENILFSAPYDERRYRQVLDACCLLPDLASFKAGDLSNIGENGVGLSGGQKARVALARAIYSRARILLLDDPIAALDHQTAETIMRKLFSFGRASSAASLMEGRLVLFVTHRVGLVSRYADQVLELTDGGRVRSMPREELSLHAAELLHRISSVVNEPHEDEEEDGQQGDNDAIPDKFIEEEYRAHGGVMASVYWRYVKAGGLQWWIALVACFVAFRAARIGYFWFLKVWGEAYQSESQPGVLLGGSDSAALPLHFYDSAAIAAESAMGELRRRTEGWMPDVDFGLPSPDIDVKPWLFWFTVISLVQVLAYILSDLTLVVLVYNAGRRLFEDVMHRVSRATFRFYDVTPVGRLMNRLTSDINTIDGQIANQLMQVAWSGIGWVSSVLVIAAATPLFLALTLAMTATFVFIFTRFLPASQSLRRLEMVSLSPLMSNFGTLLDGLTTVRAFRAQPQFQARVVATTDAFQKMDHFYWSLQAWLAYRFDILSAASTFALTLTALASGLSGGSVAFVLASTATFVDTTHTMCRKYGELQMQFVSVERVIELLDLPQEDDGDTPPSAPPANWPSPADDIVFNDVTLRYAPHLEPSLAGASFRIPAGSTVAVTGRTGSGKSTLALALLGTVLPDRHRGGRICIGDIDVVAVDKEALRRRVSFVAQDPVLFPGTLRDNLDPLREHGDAECAAVLSRVFGGENGGVPGGSFTLESRVDAGGKNLSQGQRQLVGLGRALLRRSPLVILDEATASIDFTTAFYIQQVLRDELRESTVITIAHRVEAVKDANYALVLDKGRVVSCGPTGG